MGREEKKENGLEALVNRSRGRITTPDQGAGSRRRIMKMDPVDVGKAEQTMVHGSMDEKPDDQPTPVGH
jgi:hypothetical protein